MNAEIEYLIEMAIANGFVTEKERAIILRKAEELGEDVDEVKMILEGKIFQLKNNTKVLPNTFPAPPIEKKSNKHGDLKKCPSCGASIESFKMNCPECGHEFKNIDANKSIKLLEEKIQKIRKEDYESSFDYEEEVVMIIKNHPIPTTKEDLFEMLSYLSGKVISSTENDEIIEAYQGRAIEMINKLLFMQDISPSIIERVKFIEAQMQNRKKKNITNSVLMYIGIILLLVIIYYGGYSLVKALFFN